MRLNAPINNRLLYQYIREAYEYVSAVSDEEIHKRPDDIQARLSEAYEKRLASILETSIGGQDAGGDDFDAAKQAINHTLDQNQDVLITGNNDDFVWSGEIPPDFEQELVKDFEEDASQIAELGTDIYATYLPIHFFFTAPEFPQNWGIYIAERGVMRLGAVLKRRYIESFGEPPSDEDTYPQGKDGLFLDIAYQVLLRHELEHFKIESFALNAQLFLHKPIYTPYLVNVYAETYPDVYCLEEGLANATVLDSRKIEGIFKKLYPNQSASGCKSAISSEFFDKQKLPCYRNYRLDDGWEKQNNPPVGRKQTNRTRRTEAMNYLCNQILSGEIRPDHQVPFYAFPPDNHFLRQEDLVPIHLVPYLDSDNSFVRVATPKRKNWMQFLRQLGYTKTDLGKGDHERWRSHDYQLPDLTLNFNRNELEFGSFMSSLKNLGITRRDYLSWQSTGKLPKKLATRLNP